MWWVKVKENVGDMCHYDRCWEQTGGFTEVFSEYLWDLVKQCVTQLGLNPETPLYDDRYCVCTCWNQETSKWAQFWQRFLTFIFTGLDKGDFGGPGWTGGNLWPAFGSRGNAPLTRGTVIPPAAAATLSVLTSARTGASTCSFVAASTRTTAVVVVAFFLLAILFLVLWHCLSVPWTRNRDLHLPFPSNSLGKTR